MADNDDQIPQPRTVKVSAKEFSAKYK